MTIEPKIHELLQKPPEVSLDYRASLITAYDEHIAGLTGNFNGQGATTSVPVTVNFLSDNGGDLDDTAANEVAKALRDSASIVSVLSGIARPELSYNNTPAQSWVQSGFDFAQTTRYETRGVGNVTFLNCAPRLDERGQDGNKSNKGEPIYVAVLPDGHVISANSRYNFTFFRDMVENGELEIFEANVQCDGTQFRSRDIFPLHAMVLANQLAQNLSSLKPGMSLKQRKVFLEKIGYVNTEKPLILEDIPELQKFTVAQIDVHGNVKTNTRLSDLDDAQITALRSGPFKVLVGDQEFEAAFTDRMFDRGSDGRGLSVGSSGHDWQGADHGDGFIEISIIGGNAAQALGIEPEAMKTPIQIIILGIFEPELNTSNVVPFHVEPGGASAPVAVGGG